MVIGNDTSHHNKALMSASVSRLSRPLSDCRTEPRNGRVSYNMSSKIDKPSMVLPVIDSPKTLWYTNDSSGAMMNDSAGTPDAPAMDWYLEDTCEASSESARIRSYEQETWRLYHRIQMARKDNANHWPSAMPPAPMNDLCQEPRIWEDDLNCSSLHHRRGDDELDQPIIFDLEL